MDRKRMLAFAIDWGISMLLSFALCGILFWTERYLESSIQKNFYIACLILLPLPVLSLYLKDIVGGKSIGKRIMGLRVVLQGGKEAGIVRLLPRNVTLIIWPVELINFLISGKRIGDHLAGTMLIDGDGTVKYFAHGKLS